VTVLEAIAVVFSIACVVLAARRHVGTWPAGIVAVIAYFVVFVQANLYADATLQVVFLGQGVYGWYRWSLAANWLLARRMIDNWALWLTADVLYIGLFVSKELFASAALYVVFLALAITGWRSWLRIMAVNSPLTAGSPP
jgi:nicotinamide riboside transporter PnuC